MDFINKILIFEEAWSDDKKRKSFIINFISFVLVLFISFIILIRFLSGTVSSSSSKESIEFLILIILFLCLMVFLVKKGFVRLVSCLIILLLLTYSLKRSFTLGVDAYTVDIIYPFIILLGAILISSKFSFFVLSFICINFILIYFLQKNTYILGGISWKENAHSFLNLLTVLMTYLLMTFLSWLSSREIEKSLIKSKKLAKQLELQNENLEKIVEERTRELKVLQLKQLTKIAPLLDLGKLSAGLIHDIREPLSVLSVILQNAKQNKNIIHDLDKAFLAIDKIDDLSRMSSCKLFSKSELEVFNLNQEIKKLVSLFEYNSRLKKVKIIFKPNKEFELHADRKKLNQVLANLILNALESYNSIEKSEKYIFIKLIKKPRNLLIVIKDYGIGIRSGQLKHIFEPGFSSKDENKSLGFGLYVSQEVMNNIYNSKIKVESTAKVGSTFSLFIKNKFLLN